MIKKLKKEQLLIGVLAGILLLVIAIPIPETQEKEDETQTQVLSETVVVGMEEELKAILQKIAGVGRTEVFITYEDQGMLIVEKDESVSEELISEEDSSGGTRTTTITRNDRETVYNASNSPYIVQELSPTVKGVLVVAQGAGNASVKKQIQETIEALFGLEAHKISIMKMEVSK